MKEVEFENGSAETQPESNEISVKEDHVQRCPNIPPPADLAGKWIAVDDDQERVLAWADTFPQLLELIEQKGLGDPEIHIAPGFPPNFYENAAKLLEGESPEILTDIYKTIPEAEQWLNTPNDYFGSKAPRELIGTPNEWQLRFMLRRIWYGCYS